MSIIKTIDEIELASAHLDTAVRGLYVLSDHMDEDDLQHFVCFMANHFGAIREQLQRGINKAIEADRTKDSPTLVS